MMVVEYSNDVLLPSMDQWIYVLKKLTDNYMFS